MFNPVLASFALFIIILGNAKAIRDEYRTEIQSKIVGVGADCFKEHPLGLDDIAAFKIRRFPDGENAGCFTSCLFKKIGIFDETGILSRETAIEHAKEIIEDETELQNVRDFFTACASVNDEDVTDGELGCDRAKLAFNCFVENSEKFGLNLDF